jgi:hypothetical protein
VELKRLGRDVLVIDREKRVGDNWRLRYDGLKLHNKTPIGGQASPSTTWETLLPRRILRLATALPLSAAVTNFVPEMGERVAPAPVAS